MIMKKDELQEILRKHKMWLNDNRTGSRADLRYADLRDADLRYADLRWADLRDARLRYADLRWADLSDARLTDADLKYAILRDANFECVDLRCADLRWASLSDCILRGSDLSDCIFRGADLTHADLRNIAFTKTDLRYTNLSNADLMGSDLRNADLMGANLQYANLKDTYINYPMACPEKGTFIGFKGAGLYIVELEISDDALRSSSVGRKCRCSKAKVISITDVLDETIHITSVESNHDPNFVYTVGETVKVDNFDTNRWNECAPGIHFFMTREETFDYIF